MLRLAYIVFRMLFRLKVIGLGKLPPRTPFILAANHFSYLDGLIICSLLPYRVVERMFILGYSEYFEGPISARIARVLNIVPVDPSMALVRALQVGAQGLRDDRVLLIFPEGERSITGQVGEFKKGAAVIAYELGVPVVPVGIRGTYEVWPRGGSFRLHPVEIVFGKPIDPARLRAVADPYSRLNEEVRAAVESLART